MGVAWSIDDAHLDLAEGAVTRHALRTPLVPAPALGRGIWLKLETEQVTGSFKVRGALTRLAALPSDAHRRGVIAASAGNHGLGVAFAARVLGLTARVFVPRGTPHIKREGMVAQGAHVVVTDASGYDATERIARAAAVEEDAVFLSPYDNPWVAAGNGGTVGLEMLGQMPGLMTLVAPVGGGGLMTGLAAARRRLRRPVRLVGVQSEACPAMAESIAQGRAIEVREGSATLAEGLEGGVSPTTFAHVREAVERIDLVSEAAIAEAMRFAWRALGLRVEGSAAVVLAWAQAQAARTEGPVGLVVTGRNVNPEVLARLLRESP